MSHLLPKLSDLSDHVGDKPIRRESGTRRASRAKFDGLGGEESELDNERPTVPIPRSGRVVRGTHEPLCSDGASVDVPPTEGTLSDLAAWLGPARSLEAPVVEEPSFDVRPTLPWLLLPIPLHPEPAADDPVEAREHRFGRTPSDSAVSSGLLTASATEVAPTLHGGREHPRSRRYLVAAAVVLGLVAVIVGIGRSGPPAGSAPAAGASVASEALPGGSTARPAASAQLGVERTPDEATAPVNELPAALSVASAKPASSGRTPVSAPSRAQKGSRSTPKRSKDMDFGI